MRDIYQITNKGEFSRDFALKDQIRRAAISVMANIAEGFERRSDREFHRFLEIAKASAGEVASELYIAFDVGYIEKDQFHQFLEQTLKVGRIIGGFMRYLKEGISRAK